MFKMKDKGQVSQSQQALKFWLAALPKQRARIPGNKPSSAGCLTEQMYSNDESVAKQ